MGPRVHSSGTHAQVALHRSQPSCEWLDACESYKHRVGTYITHVGVKADGFQLFKRMLDQYDRLRRRNAFLEQYKKEKMFENGFEEFDESR